MSGRGERRFDTVAKIDPDNLLRTPFGREFRMPALAAAAFEHDLAFKKVARSPAAASPETDPRTFVLPA